VHGLRGHPKNTWVNSCDVSIEEERSSRSLLERFVSSFKAKPSVSTADGKESDERLKPRQIFWPRDYLVQDIPQARVWTYGYNADIISGPLQGNNKNSVSDHGRDLRQKVERDIKNNVAWNCAAWVERLG
jgi:hypothetical protein